MNQNDLVFIEGIRTPFSKFGGKLKSISSVDLAATMMRELIQRSKVTQDVIEEIYIGTCMQGESALNGPTIARQAILKAGFPPTTVSMAVDRACCSSLAAVELAWRAVKSGQAESVIACGTENMSRTPLLLSPDVRWGSRLGHLNLEDNLYELGFKDYNPVAVDAGEVALEHGISRIDQDEWALQSQRRYEQARQKGYFQEEIVPVSLSGGAEVLAEDEGPRPQTTMQALERLSTIYGSPTVTAGNAPGLSTGSAAILLTSRKKANELGVKPLASIVSATSVAAEPRLLACSPAPAIQKALKVAGLTLDDMNLLEINEAFAALPLVATKILAEGDEQKWARLQEKTNVNGGAIAIGHPVGASGARILLHLVNELRRRGERYGVAAICGGLAQGQAAVVRMED